MFEPGLCLGMKLRHRYSISIFLIGSLCIAAMLADRALSTQKLLGERAEARAEALAAAAAREIIDPLQKGDDKTVQDRLRILSELRGVERIQVVDMGGRPTHGSGRRFGHPDEEALHRTGRELFAGPGGEARAVEVSISADGFKRAIFPVLARGALSGALSILFLGLASWWLGRLAGAKIEALSSAVATMDGAATPKLPDIARNSEIGALSRAFLDLHRRLKEEGARRRTMEAQRDDMINMLVHDLKHPLTIFRMSMSILKDIGETSHAAGFATALSLATRSTARMEAMLDGVLQAAVMENAPRPPERVRTPIVDFVKTCAAEDALIVKASKRPWSLEIDPGLEGSWILAHPAMLRRLVGNLVLNAVDHAPEGTPVTFGARRAEKDASSVEIFVSNAASQIQMEPEAMLRGKYHSSGDNSHAGLGLAFCRLAAKSHSGRIGARLRDDGQVVFSVIIPMGRGETPPALTRKEVSAHEAD